MMKRYFPTVSTLLAIVSTASAIAIGQGNERIAFVSTRDGNAEIYRMNGDGTDQVRLTNNSDADSNPAFSPDGQRIAYVSERRVRQKRTTVITCTIKLINSDGTGQVTLTPIACAQTSSPWHEKFSLSWSPDGNKIAFQENGDIVVVNSDGSGRVKLTSDPYNDQEPSWSPNGAQILFVSNRTYFITLHTMNADGSNIQSLPSDGEFWDTSPSYSRAGDKMAFVVQSEDRLPMIYTANFDGTNRQAFDDDGMGSAHRNKPRWAPDGMNIAFHVWDYFTGDTEIYIKGVADGIQTQLTNTSGSNFQPSYGP